MHSVNRAMMIATLAGLATSLPARADSLRDQLNEMQDSLDIIQMNSEDAADAAAQGVPPARRYVPPPAPVPQAAQPPSFDLPPGCAAALDRAPAGTLIDCDAFRKPMPAPSQPRQPAPDSYQQRLSDWKPMPGAQGYYYNDIKDTAPAASGAVNQSVLAYLDAAPDLAGRWRQMNEDPTFLAWLGQIDPSTGQKRQALLNNAYAAGDAMRTATFFRAYIGVTDPTPYTYLPTEQDRAEIRACVAAAGPTTTIWDCVKPTGNRVRSQLKQDTVSAGQAWPAHPSQGIVMMQMVVAVCGIRIDQPEAYSLADAACVNGEAKKVTKAIVMGLSIYAASLAR